MRTHQYMRTTMGIAALHPSTALTIVGNDMNRIQNNITVGLAIVVLLTATAASAYDSTEAVKQRTGSGDPVAGKSKSQLCQGCHGEDGNSTETTIPKLAGQYSSYISKQLRNYQSGVRTHDIMSAMAATIDEADLADIAAYFASQKKMKGDGTGENPVARSLFFNGDSARNIQSCMSCHGVNGKGIFPGSSTFPVLGGQHRAYLREQLINWRNGKRANSPNGVMNNIIKPLTDAEIEALADFMSGR